MSLDQTHASFNTTRWTLVGDLASPDPDAQRLAFEAVVRNYWPAVYGTLRRRGFGREQAQELTQDFFTEVVLGRRLLIRADPGRGRLRSLLLAALNNYLVDQARRDAARGGGRTVELGDLEREEEFLAAAPHDADAFFDRRFALAAAEEALRRCEAHYTANGKAKNWSAYFAHVLAPYRGGTTPVPLTAIAAEHGFRSPADAGAAIQTVRKRLDALLREVAAELTDDAATAEEEYQHLRCLIS